MGTLQLEEREEALAPGDVLFVNPDEPHAIINQGSEARFVCLDCYLGWAAPSSALEAT